MANTVPECQRSLAPAGLDAFFRVRTVNDKSAPHLRSVPRNNRIRRKLRLDSVCRLCENQGRLTGNLMTDTDPRQQFDFDQIDADAVCEKCGTVNPEPTLICKTCGNNLRDQRLRRISNDQIAVPGAASPVSRIRVFTTVLTGLGILLVLLAVVNIGNIEDWLVGMQVEANVAAGMEDVWSGPGSVLYNQMAEELRTNPVTRAEQDDAMANPVIDTSFNGRYLLSKPDAQGKNVIVGSAILSRRGERVHFVATLNQRNVEIRGFAELTVNESNEVSPFARNTASIDIGGTQYTAWGYAVGNPDGSHTVYGQSGLDNNSYGVLAYRVR
jgi:hypothetical protein